MGTENLGTFSTWGTHLWYFSSPTDSLELAPLPISKYCVINYLYSLERHECHIRDILDAAKLFQTLAFVCVTYRTLRQKETVSDLERHESHRRDILDEAKLFQTLAFVCVTYGTA